MTNLSSSSKQFAATILDDFAIEAMHGLLTMQAFNEQSVADSQNDADAYEEWCSSIATRSYYLACAMVEARNDTYKIIEQVSKKREEQND